MSRERTKQQARWAFYVGAVCWSGVTGLVCSVLIKAVTV